MHGTATSETFPDGTEPGKARRLPVTPARRTALAIGVPVCLALTGWLGYSIVADIGQGHFPVSATAAVGGGPVSAHVGGGDVLLEQGPGGQATLTGTAHYSLIRPRVTEQRTAGGVAFGYDCGVDLAGNCGLDGTLTVPAGTATTVSTDGGNATASGTTGDVTLSSGGGDVTADNASGDLTLNTDGGNITGTGLTASRVTAGAAGGDVRIEFTSVPRDVRIHTDGGNITLIVPGTVQYNVSAAAGGGTVSDSLSVNPASANTITVSADGGDITLSAAPSP